MKIDGTASESATCGMSGLRAGGANYVEGGGVEIDEKPTCLEKALSDEEYESSREKAMVVDEGSEASLQPEQIDMIELKSVEEMIRKASLK